MEVSSTTTSDTSTEPTTDQINLICSTPKLDQTDDSKDLSLCEENILPSLQREEETIKKKYGGLLPKKPPLISKDHEHAFFDSADWALGKKSKGPLEALQPKLQPSPHLQVRSRSAYASGSDIIENGENFDNANPVANQDGTLDGSNENQNQQN